jgi:hypothetical protein
VHDVLVAVGAARPLGREEVNAMDEQITIECDGCRGRELNACGDCVVSFILGREPGDALIIDAEEARAVRLLGDVGLVPPLRFDQTGS